MYCRAKGNGLEFGNLLVDTGIDQRSLIGVKVRKLFQLQSVKQFIFYWCKMPADDCRCLFVTDRISQLEIRKQGKNNIGAKNEKIAGNESIEENASN